MSGPEKNQYFCQLATKNFDREPDGLTTISIFAPHLGHQPTNFDLPASM